MVNLTDIEKSIDEAITTKGLMVVKCKPSYRPSILRAFQKYADQYGFTMKSYKDKDIYNNKALVTLYDPQHNTAIEFSKDFINENLIDFQNTGKKKIDIETIFSAYDQLPNKCKYATGLIQYSFEDQKKEINGRDVCAWCSEWDEENLEFHTITIPSYYFQDGFENNNPFELVLAHESMHARDYREKSQSGMNAYIKRELEGENSLTPTEKEAYEKINKDMMRGYNKYRISGAIDWKSRGEVLDFDDFEKYLDGYFKNRDYLNGDTRGYPNVLNKSSDYGRTEPSEDYAEYGAMVITGYHNPTNPNSRIMFNGEWIQYQEWARLHPYTVQGIVRDLYDEEPSIDDILNDTIPTRYGEFGVKIEDFK